MGLDNNHPILRQAMQELSTAKLAIAAMEQHGLIEQGWKFRVSKTKRTLGRCFYEQKIIEFSEHYLHQPWYEIEDTILHEIAHALAYLRYGEDGKGHGSLWRKTCIEVGARPERLAPPGVKTAAKPNYVRKCSSCGKVLGYNFRLRRQRLIPGLYKSNCCNANVDIYEIRR